MPESENLRKRYGGGPHGLGDPDDLSLRKVEKDVLIPEKMRGVSRNEKCKKEVEEFKQCCSDHQILFVFKCRKENTIMQDCLVRWYHNDEFRAKCTEDYLEERSEYRRTGITKKQKQRMQIPT